jgi:hypothetical protein
MFWRRRSSRPVIALALVLGLGAIVVGAGFVHTDDGCAFETHCQSCLWAAGSIVVVSPAIAMGPALEAVAHVPPQPTTRTSEPSSRSETSRGPPQS